MIKSLGDFSPLYSSSGTSRIADADAFVDRCSRRGVLAGIAVAEKALTGISN
jgi:hypothetical protein